MSEHCYFASSAGFAPSLLSVICSDESDACESPEEAQGALAAASPGAGCIGLVLRTGFYSTQGDILWL